MKLLIPTEILKAATVYVNGDETRYNTNCLLFEGGNVIATNGHSLLVWRHGADLNANAGVIPSVGKDLDFLIAFTKDALKFIKATAKKVCLTFGYDTETYVLSDGYGQSITLNKPPLVNDFPDYRRGMIMLDVQTFVPIIETISTEIIETFAEYAKARRGKGVHGFTVLSTGIGNPFYLMPYDFDDCFIVNMPMRSKQTLDDHLETIGKVMGATETLKEAI